MTVGPGFARLTAGEPLILMVSGRPARALLAPGRERTLVSITADLCNRFHRRGLWFDGCPYIEARMQVDALGRTFDVWAGRHLRAEVEIGRDLARALGW